MDQIIWNFRIYSHVKHILHSTDTKALQVSSTAFIECKDLQPSLTVVVAQCASASRTPPPSRLPASIVQPPPSIFRGHSTSAADCIICSSLYLHLRCLHHYPSLKSLKKRALKL